MTLATWERTARYLPRPPQDIISFLNSKGFTISVYQSGPPGLLAHPDAKEYQWSGSIYSADRHREFAKTTKYLPWEEKVKEESFYYQLVTHRQPTLEAALGHLLSEYHSPTVPPRAQRSSFNPAFGRHKKKAGSVPVTDDDLLA